MGTTMLKHLIHGKRTKVIATLGPASNSKEIIEQMIIQGVDVVRLNASHHRDPSVYKKMVQTVRKVAKKAHRHVSIFLDLQGPKIRVGKIKKGTRLNAGDSVILTSNPLVGTAETVYINYPSLVQDLNLGDPIYIDDGRICLEVTQKEKEHLCANVKVGGELSDYKGVNFPNTTMSTSPITEKDQKDIQGAIAAKVDYIALSFVSDPEDIVELRGILDQSKAKGIRIIAKIERPQAVEQLSAIIKLADAVMVARGDLGVEIGVEKVPKIQKRIIRNCNRHLTPVIVATQMLESMIHSEVATRAEVSDVANAIYDLCDAVMLSGETAIGVNPVNVIKVISQICKESDHHVNAIRNEEQTQLSSIVSTHARTSSFCIAAEQIAIENNATAIMTFTSSGSTPLFTSKLSAILPILAPTDNELVCSQMALYRGVIPIMMGTKFSKIHRWTDMIHVAVKEAKALSLLKTGDIIVVTAGIPIGKSQGTNSIRLIEI